MSKTDKELAVELAVAVINTIPQMQSQRAGAKAAISGKDVSDILNDCYNAVSSLDSGT